MKKGLRLRVLIAEPNPPGPADALMKKGLRRTAMRDASIVPGPADALMKKGLRPPVVRADSIREVSGRCPDEEGTETWQGIAA